MKYKIAYYRNLTNARKNGHMFCISITHCGEADGGECPAGLQKTVFGVAKDGLLQRD